ncbi:MAG: hypothetical protein ABJ360_11935 [Roseobacter sp.]
MNAITEVRAMPLQWYAVRLKAKQNGGARATFLGAEYESYVGRGGHKKKRRLRDTGKRAFVPEVILRRDGDRRCRWQADVFGAFLHVEVDAPVVG